jgi:hypothetical protein
MNGPEGLAALIVAFIIAAIIGVAIIFSSYRCSAHWAGSGMSTNYGPIQGCLIQHDGKWIPEQNYREMP